MNQNRLTPAIIFTLAFAAMETQARVDPSEVERHAQVRPVLNQKTAPDFFKRLEQQQPLTARNRFLVVFDERANVGFAPSHSARLNRIKQRVNDQMPKGRFRLVHHYDQLPMQALALDDSESLIQLLASPDVAAVYVDEPLHLHLAESLPLTHQDYAQTYNLKGKDTSVVVLDSGVDYTHSAFGACTAPGQPDTCRVSASLDIAADDGALDSNGHGTNVSAIVLGIAPEARIISLDITAGTNLLTSDAIAGINWAIANRQIYNIAAINMSFGSSTLYPNPCSTWNPFTTPINNARLAGIALVASSGNSANSTGIASPACTPGVLAIGALYDKNHGGLNWSVCVDNTTEANQVACFSNAASYLFLLAPGAMITAGGKTYSGTSQAAPHVAGAVALLKSAYPDETLSEIENRLQESNTIITDPRNNQQTPLLDLQAAIGPIEVESSSTKQIPAMPFAGMLIFAVLLGFLSMRPRFFELNNFIIPHNIFRR